ncbi:MAG: homocysteine S-methyltransferase family protein [Acholeplasmatales bacterium]|nr:homocysteine S-methyltransferase family protein [Acholeplasmatales bacterium]
MLLDNLGKKIMIFDGGMGSEIEKKGLSGFIPEELNITNPDDIYDIHKSYKNSDFITTNTFGLNRIKYHGNYSIKEIAEAAISNARRTNKIVMFDIGPTGGMLKPIGTLSFDDAYNAFKEVVECSRDLVDGYILETFTDLYEVKAALLAVKENSDKPAFVTMTFDQSGRTLTGSTPEIMVNTLEGLGADCIGVNCSLGPKELYPIIEKIINCAHKPIIIQPNRGLPTLKNGKTIYTLEYNEFDEYVKKYIDMGVAVVGGCCGTNPEFIEGISKYKGLNVNRKENPYNTTINSATVLLNIENVKVCGERLNPTGKKKLKQALIDGDYDYLVKEAIKEEEAGADLLDLNVGVPKIDEVNAMVNSILKVQEYCDLPIQIDSSNKDAIEAGCRYYNGIPLINSVNGEDAVMERVFPIAKKYGAIVLGLALDDKGVPKTAEERFEIAKKIIKKAEEYGIPKNRIMIDTLVLTASAEQDLVKETLKGLTLVRGLGVKTALGVSNVSFGLPNRGLLNKTFLAMAMYAGLNMPILNPLDTEMMGAIKAYNVLLGIDRGSETYIDTYKDVEISVTTVTNNKEKVETGGTLDLYNAVKKGLKPEIKALTLKEIEANDPIYVINEVLIKALNDVGLLYEKGKLFLPQLIASAEAAKESFSVISDKFPKSDKAKATIVMATVKGDVHDIGKNICKVVLESYGYEVIDLGKDTPIEKVIEADNKYKPFAIGLSALMTTTVLSMEDTIKALRGNNTKAKIFVGGAVVTEEIAKEIGADYYSKDALSLVTMMEELINEKK